LKGTYQANVAKPNTDFIELRDPSNSSYAKIFLKSGGSLQELILDNTTIIQELNQSASNELFASSILFPFTGRVKNSKYIHNNTEYQLETNSKEEKIALHGLIYNCPFEIIEESSSGSSANLKLRFSNVDVDSGFPFRYTIELSYTLHKYDLMLEVTIENTDITSFPYCIGWHPYFYSRDLYNSQLVVNSDKKISFDKRMVPIEVVNAKTEELQIKDKVFDDCYVLNDDTVYFKTPDHTVEISSSSPFSEHFLQIFTPEIPNTIAIEPLTGPPDSFNNKLGLQVLESNEKSRVSWNIKLKK
jgi:aldose 1-epimerase